MEPFKGNKLMLSFADAQKTQSLFEQMSTRQNPVQREEKNA